MMMKATEIKTSADLNRYEAQEYNKALLDGRDSAWKAYSRRIAKAQQILEDEYNRTLKAERVAMGI